MDAATKPLVLDLVQWVAEQPRPYTEVMEAWRTSCPRLTIWANAVEEGLVARDRAGDGAVFVRATARGLDWLQTEGRRAHFV